jgi:hypothetical protein
MRTYRERVGDIMYGYQLSSDGTHLEADETEQAAMVRIATVRQAGKTLRDIAWDLNERGHRTHGVSEWRYGANSWTPAWRPSGFSAADKLPRL